MTRSNIELHRPARRSFVAWATSVIESVLIAVRDRNVCPDCHGSYEYLTDTAEHAVFQCDCCGRVRREEIPAYIIRGRSVADPVADVLMDAQKKGNKS